jgi:hypothetical protein
MPGPTTEVLNDDVKDLRDELHKVEIAIKDDLHMLKDELTVEIHRVSVAVEKLASEFHFAKWLFGLLLVTAVSMGLAGVWWAASITSDLRNITKTLEQSRIKESS